ncbi:hypothetical protein LCGC14_2075840, partial [marine sediment metagenome]
MTVRAANFSDIPDIVGIMEDSHRSSRDAELTTFDEIEAKQLLVRCIQRHQQNYMGSLVLVAERKGVVMGFVIGILDQVHPCLKELKVTDLLFMMLAGADPRDGRAMAQQLILWGQNNPKVIKALLGTTDDMTDWERVGKMYEGVGLEQC